MFEEFKKEFYNLYTNDNGAKFYKCRPENIWSWIEEKLQITKGGQVDLRVMQNLASQNGLATKEDGYTYCDECNGKLLLLHCIGHGDADAEPYKDGEEIEIDERFDVGHFQVRFCEKCYKTKEIWIDKK